MRSTLAALGLLLFTGVTGTARADLNYAVYTDTATTYAITNAFTQEPLIGVPADRFLNDWVRNRGLQFLYRYAVNKTSDITVYEYYIEPHTDPINMRFEVQWRGIMHGNGYELDSITVTALDLPNRPNRTNQDPSKLKRGPAAKGTIEAFAADWTLGPLFSSYLSAFSVYGQTDASSGAPVAGSEAWNLARLGFPFASTEALSPYEAYSDLSLSYMGGALRNANLQLLINAHAVKSSSRSFMFQQLMVAKAPVMINANGRPDVMVCPAMPVRSKPKK